MSEVNNLLIVGSGGREFAFMEEALRSGVRNVFSTRGEDAVNRGIENVINTGIGEDPKDIESWSKLDEMDLVLVGPEKPLVKGIGEKLRSRGVAVFGPNSDGAIFEADKTQTHDFVIRHGLPNPDDSETYSPEQREAAKDHIRQLGVGRVVTKRVGLEGGKGAKKYTEEELEAALAEVDAVADKGEDLLIQGRLLGPEYSGTFMLDGKGGVVATALSRDHKSLFNWGKGPMTGGMAAFAPLGLEQANVGRRNAIRDIGLVTANGLVIDGIDYRGTVYAGVMAETEDPDSPIKVIEFNVRFGDPETQVILRSLGCHAIDLMNAAAHGSMGTDLDRIYMTAGEELVSMTVCLASPGYSQIDPTTGKAMEVVTGLPIFVPENLPDDISIQFAGAKMVDGSLVSTGGRVLYVTRTAPAAVSRDIYKYIGRENGGVFIGEDEQLIRTDVGLV